MSFTLTQHKALCEALAGGYRVVQYDGKKVEYQSVADLEKALNRVEADLIARGLLTPPSAGGIQRGGTTFAAYDPD